MVSNIFTAEFTDIYGVTHSAAQCMISAIYRNDNAIFNEKGERESSNASCSYNVRYWHSADAKSEGARPQEYLSSNSYNTFQIDGDSASDATVEACQAHFLNTVLPQGKAAA